MSWFPAILWVITHFKDISSYRAFAQYSIAWCFQFEEVDESHRHMAQEYIFLNQIPSLLILSIVQCIGCQVWNCLTNDCELIFVDWWCSIRNAKVIWRHPHFDWHKMSRTFNILKNCRYISFFTVVTENAKRQNGRCDEIKYIIW